ncbi:MAG: hypothetical protein RL095_4204 [Verrucomicrobiota bacterium]|jgi:chitinase
MLRSRFFLLLVFGFLAAAAIAQAPAPAAKPVAKPAVPAISPRVVGYYGAWTVYNRKFFVRDIDAARLTHLNYAFAKLSAKGEVILGDAVADTGVGARPPGGVAGGNFAELRELKRRFPHLKTLISIGGANDSDHFTRASATAAGRQRFAASALKFILDHGFDGADIDWEYPCARGEKHGHPDDRKNFTLLLQELRRQFDARGRADKRPYLLSAAVGAGPEKVAGTELDKYPAFLDWIVLMSYDYSGPWSPRTGFGAPLQRGPGDVRVRLNIHATVQAFIDGGVPASKICLGIPFYGFVLGQVPPGPNQDGLYQDRQAPIDLKAATMLPYRDIEAAYLGQPGWKAFYSAICAQAYLYNAGTRQWVSYDDRRSMAAKGAYIRMNRLGGAAIWELSGDGGKLLPSLHQAMSPGK